MANGHDAIEGWEWETVFSLSDAPILEQDSIWQTDLTEAPLHPLAAEVDLSSSSGPPNASAGSDEWRSGPGSLSRIEHDHQTPLLSEPSFDNSSDVSKQKKRDRRLDCPNFLAGRIPCSCPEIDELEDGETEDTSKKRPKTKARCQVPSCGGDISDLKGYHQRHRVCLGCANSPKVILKDQPHRYCQQCGKFHRLSDFDEGKRSCRRKLERHNKRRRRRPLEVGPLEVQEKSTSVLSSEKDHGDVGASIDVASNPEEARPSSSTGGVLKVLVDDSLENRNLEVERLSYANAASTKDGLFASKVFDIKDASSGKVAECSIIRGLAHTPPIEDQQFPSTRAQMHNSLSSCQQSIENYVGGHRGQSVHSHNSSSQDGDISAGGSAKEFDAVIEKRHVSDASSAVGLRLGASVPTSNRSKSDEQSWLEMLIDDTTEGVEMASSPKNAKQHYSSKSELPRSSLYSSCHNRCSGYISPCTTGRISFKLYDWNPADFPRRLRQQIFKWLANMPVELEGYIRSGCVILTFFITMPQASWDKIIDDWIGHVQKVIVGLGCELWGKGQIIARLNDKSVHIRDGKILRAGCKKKLNPILLDVYPLSLEAGCATDIYIFGFNLCRTNSRFLVSFGEQYMECKGCERVDHCYTPQRTASLYEGSLEIWKITVFFPDTKMFGPAYIEVDNDYGVSAFMPILIADKGICAEVNSSVQLRSESLRVNHEVPERVTRHCKAHSLAQQCIADLITDLGWVFRYMADHKHIKRAEVRDALMRRLERLLLFSLRHNWQVVVKRLFDAAIRTGLTTGMGVGSDGLRRGHLLNLEVVKQLLDTAITNGLTTGMGVGSDGRHPLHLDVVKVFRESKNVLDGEDLSLLECFLTLPEVTVCGAGISYASSSEQCKELQEIKASEVSKEKLSNFPSMDCQFLASGNLFSPLVDEGDSLEVPLLEKRVHIVEDGLQRVKSSCILPLGWLKRPTGKLTNMSVYASDRRLRRIVGTALSIVMLCVGMCIILQHPHQVTEISMSLRRCLWVSKDTVPLD